MKVNLDTLAREIAADTDISIATSKAIVSQIFEVITENMEQGHEVAIPAFGKFRVKHRKERDARNPRTGEIVTVAAKTVPNFLPAKQLKERVNGA